MTDLAIAANEMYEICRPVMQVLFTLFQNLFCDKHIFLFDM